MRQLLTISLLFSTIRLATPLVLAAIGGLYSERSGVINIALEGLMLAGAFTAASITYYAHSPWVGMGAAIVAGALVAMIIALACIRFKADQVVTGTGINIMLIGLPAVLSGALFLSSGSTPQIPRENLLPALYRFFPFLPPWRVLTDVSVISVLALIVVVVTAYILYRTPFGLRLRAVGENPEAADAAGVSVNRIRYIGVVLSGALAGLGGAYLSIGQSSLFTRNMAAGRGFIALALYLAEGVAGLPVFAPVGAPGILRFIGPTAGYLISYPFVAALAGYIFERGKRTFTNAASAAIAGELLLFASGISWLFALSHSLSRAIAFGLYWFIFAEVMKVMFAAGVVTTWRRFVPQA